MRCHMATSRPIDCPIASWYSQRNPRNFWRNAIHPAAPSRRIIHNDDEDAFYKIPTFPRQTNPFRNPALCAVSHARPHWGRAGGPLTKTFTTDQQLRDTNAVTSKGAKRWRRRRLTVTWPIRRHPNEESGKTALDIRRPNCSSDVFTMPSI